MQGIFTVLGLEAYLEKMAKAGRDIDPAADKAVQAGGEVVFNAMVDRVAVDTGALKAHLEATGKKGPQREGNLHFMEIGLMDLGAAGASYGAAGKRSKRKTYPRQFLYGIILEFGKTNMAAQPYVRPAFDNNHAKVRAAELDALKATGLL